jgi:DNA-binding MarR family transcriptional regulator
MSDAETLGALDESIGYVLKQAAFALRGAMEAELRSLDLTVTQYASLELLSRSPGLSNAQLARGAFVTRQSMDAVLRGLLSRKLVTRSPTSPYGRALPIELTTVGQALLRQASAAVLAVERRMLARINKESQQRLLDDLTACATAFT